MLYHGHIHHGQVVFDQPVPLPEGAAVVVHVASSVDERNQSRKPSGRSLRPIMKFAGIAKDLPADAARNLDHNLYGDPKP